MLRVPRNTIAIDDDPTQIYVKESKDASPNSILVLPLNIQTLEPKVSTEANSKKNSPTKKQLASMNFRKVLKQKTTVDTNMKGLNGTDLNSASPKNLTNGAGDCKTQIHKLLVPLEGNQIFRTFDLIEVGNGQLVLSAKESYYYLIAS